MVELGRFQGRILQDPSLVRGIRCLSDTGFTRREYAELHVQQFTYEYLISPPCRMPEFVKEMLKTGELIFIPGKSFEYAMLRSPGCDLPKHLKQMLIDTDNRAEDIFRRLGALPTVLCHRDFWVENIFHTPEGIRLIDWDTTGWGPLGEDIASLVADDVDFDSFEENLKNCVPAYLRGVAEYADVSGVDSLHLRDQILIKFGWRMMQSYMFTRSPDEKAPTANATTRSSTPGRTSPKPSPRIF